MSKRDELLYLGHMADTARKIVARTTGLTREAFDSNEDIQIILTHLVQIVGEAARNVSVEYRAAHPEIPWIDIMGMRHRIVHDYMRVDLQTVWNAATLHVPELLAKLDQLIPQDPQ